MKKAERELRRSVGETRRTLSGSRNYGEPSGAKWGWITRQQPVPPYYPGGSPTYTLSKAPHRGPSAPLGVTPPVTLQWHHQRLLVAEWRPDQEGGPGYRGVLFTWRASQSPCIFYGCSVSLEQSVCGQLSAGMKIEIASSETLLIISKASKPTTSCHSASGSDFLQFSFATDVFLLFILAQCIYITKLD